MKRAVIPIFVAAIMAALIGWIVGRETSSSHEVAPLDLNLEQPALPSVAPELESPDQEQMPWKRVIAPLEPDQETSTSVYVCPTPPPRTQASIRGRFVLAGGAPAADVQLALRGWLPTAVRALDAEADAVPRVIDLVDEKR